MSCTGAPPKWHLAIRASGTTWRVASEVSADWQRQRRPAIGPSPSTRHNTHVSAAIGTARPAGEANHLGELKALLSRPSVDYRARLFLGYALAKELDDMGHFDEAFHWFAAAAKARRSRLSYDVTTDEHKLSRIAEAYPREA